MFNPERLSLIVQPIGDGGIRFYSYQTDDTEATLTGAGYATNAADYGLRTYDLIFVSPLSGTVDTYILAVDAIDADGHATLASPGPLGDLLAANNLSDIPDPATALANLGGMAKATYDPTNVAGDAFDMDNMVEGAVTKILTAAERAAIAALGTAAYADILDADTFAGATASNVPSAESTKAFANAKYVANRTALKALSTAAHPAAHLTEAGRAGPFVFDSSNLSAEVTADTQEGIYIAPASDATGASGAWVRQFHGDWHVSWFGAKFDGSTDDVAAFAGVVSLAPTDREIRCHMPRGVTRWASQFHLSKPILFIGEGVGEISTASSGSADPGTVIRWNGADNATMCVHSVQDGTNLAAGTTTAEGLWGGGFKDCTFYGTATAASTYAANAIWSASVVRGTYTGLKFRSFKGNSIIVDGGNGYLSSRNTFEFHIVYGTVVDTRPMNGVYFRRFNGEPSTQNTIERVFGLVYDGVAVRFADTDNNVAYRIHVVTQSGGAGGALSFEVGSTSDARNNDVFYCNGWVTHAAGTYGNTIYNYPTEASKIVGPTDGTSQLIVYGMRDYVNGAVFETPKYRTTKRISTPASMMQADGSVSTKGIHGGASNSIVGIQMPDSGNSHAFFTLPVDEELHAGELFGATFRFSATTATAANIRLQLRMAVVTAGALTSFFDFDESFTLTVSGTINTLQVRAATFAAAESIAAGDLIAVKVTRVPGDAADTAAGDIWLEEVTLNYRATVTNGLGPYNMTGPALSVAPY